MTRTIKAHFDGKVFVPDEPVDLPAGKTAEVTVQVAPPTIPPPAPPDEEYPLRSLVEWASKLPPLPDSPGDAAAQHDHYLYGTPKRGNP
jgi:hypothetical protein